MIHTLIDPISGWRSLEKTEFLRRNFSSKIWSCIFDLLLFRFWCVISIFFIHAKKRELNGIKIMHQFVWINSIDPLFSARSSEHRYPPQTAVFIDWIYDKMLIIEIVNKIRHTHSFAHSLAELTCSLMTASMQINFTWEYHIDRITMSGSREGKHTLAFAVCVGEKRKAARRGTEISQLDSTSNVLWDLQGKLKFN